MSDYEFPPFRIREQDGAPNVIPVYELIVSNGTLTNLGQGKVSLATGPGGGASTSTAGLVQSSRTISTVYPISGGGDLSSDRSHSVDTAFLINSGRIISATYPLAGGGNLSADRTLTVDTAFLINTGRTVSSTYPLSGGGNLSADRTLTVDTAFLVNSGRTISAGVGISGGGNLSADRTLSLVTPVSISSGGTSSTSFTSGGILFGGGTNAIQALAGLNSGSLIVGSATTLSPQVLTVSAGSQGYTLIINTAAIYTLSWAPSSGGGSSTVYAATGNQYVVLANAADLTAERALGTSTGITVTDQGANSNVYLTVNTNVRDKLLTFFFAGNLSTAMLAEEARIYIPYNMELSDCRVAVTTSATGANILINPKLYSANLTASSAIFASANRPIVVTNNLGGSGSTFAYTSVHLGSWLGLDVDQVGSTVAGSNMTVTFIVRTS